MKINPIHEQKITEIINGLSIEEKVLQMLQISGQGNTPETYEKFTALNTGSYLHELGEGTDRLRAKAKETNSKIPPIFGIDAIHGHSLKNGATIFPSQLAMSCSWNEELIEEMGAATAKEVNADGNDWVFSPVLCMARDTRWGRVDETFGEDPHLIGKLGAAIIRGYEKDGNVVSCAKHFIGYGEATGARDSYDTQISIRKIRETLLPPFEEAVKAGTSTIMSAYGSIDGTPLTKHKELLTDILKDELGFDGFVVTDWFNIWSMRTKQRSAECFDDSARMAIDAGNDMSMNCQEFFESVTKQVKEGKIPESQLDEAVRRILRVKFALGLFDEKERCPQSVIGCKEHIDINHKLTQESLVLLKNNGVLPLREQPKKIAVIGPNADNITTQYGDWTFTSHRPEEEFAIIKNDYYTLLRGVKTVFDRSEVTYSYGCSVRDKNDTKFDEAVKAANEADIVILAIGDELSLNGEGKDRAVLELSGAQNELVAKIKETGKPIVTVLVTGKPLCVGEACDMSDAVIQMFNGGDLGGLCAAEMIAGKFNPSGKLSISYPRASGQVPCYYNHYSGWHWGYYCDVAEGSLFDFGYGLSYTEYEYSDLTLSKEQIGNDEDFEVSVTVTNKGNMDGKEIVELYYNDVISSVMTPVINLCGFKKIELAKGESKRVTFKMNAKDLSFVNNDCKRVTEKGKFEIFAGGSLASLLKAELEVI